MGRNRVHDPVLRHRLHDHVRKILGVLSIRYITRMEEMKNGMTLPLKKKIYFIFLEKFDIKIGRERERSSVL